MGEEASAKRSARDIVMNAKNESIRKVKLATDTLIEKANKNKASFAFYVLTNLLVLLSYAFTLYKLHDPKGTITVRDIDNKEHKVKTAEFTKWDRRFVVFAAVVLAVGGTGTIAFIAYASSGKKSKLA